MASSETRAGSGPGSGRPTAGEYTPPTADAYTQMESDPRFVELRRRYRNFAFPVTVAFLAWYLLYVLMSAYARDFMDTKVVGHLNVAFFFGILQFITTFLIAYLYSRYANRRLDPLAEELNRDLGGRR
jgi:uncharacterized membrane protein (DUF485 family)